MRYLAVLFLVGCAHRPATGTVQPSEMSAAAHEEEAAREERQAKAEASRYDPNAGRPAVGCLSVAGQPPGYPCWTSVANPTSEHLRLAELHRRHAAEHRAASKALRDAEARSCNGVTEEDRALSPFFHREDVARVEPLRQTKSFGGPEPVGARIVFKPVPGMSSDWLQRLVDCHLARNAVLGGDVPEQDDDPLSLKGVTARVVHVWDGLAVEVRAADAATGVKVLARANALLE